MVDTLYLEELIKDSGKSRTHLASKCGMSRSEFYNKSHNKREFTESQATKLCAELDVTTLADRKKLFCL